MSSGIFSRIRICLAPLLALLLPLCATAADSKVRGILSSHTAGVGEPVEYELIIEGGGQLENEPALNVDGIEVRFAGPGGTQARTLQRNRKVFELAR